MLPPKTKLCFFCSLYAAALRCINPLFGCINCWRNTVWTLPIYIYIRVYIYTVYIYVYVYVYVYANTPNTHPEAFSWQNICCHICLLEMQK